MRPFENLGRNPHGNPRGQQGNQPSVVDEFKQNIKSLSELTDELIFHPSKGYGSKIAQGLDVKTVQLRRVYQEFLRIVDAVRVDRTDEAMGKLYRLYAIVQYQAGRGVISEKFKDFLHYVFDLVKDTKDYDKRKEGFYKVKDLLMSIVAYSKGG